MLTVYLGTLAFGGTLLLASLVLGQKDADHALDKDAHLGGLDWLPVASLRFWTFFLAFGGAAGTALTYAGAMPAGPVAGAALAVGWLSGVGMVAAMRAVRKGSVGSEVSPKDLRGETAEVIVPIARGAIGKVRVAAKGRLHDLIAETDDDATFAAGDRVMILGEGAEGRVQVTRS